MQCDAWGVLLEPWAEQEKGDTPGDKPRRQHPNCYHINLRGERGTVEEEIRKVLKRVAYDFRKAMSKGDVVGGDDSQGEGCDAEGDDDDSHDDTSDEEEHEGEEEEDGEERDDWDSD